MAFRVRSDEAYRAAGRMGAPEAFSYERPEQYERRLIEGIAGHSKTWARADFNKMPSEAFVIARDQVLAEVAATKTHGLKSTEIRELPSSSNAGHRVTEFAGGERAWFGNAFRREPRLAVFRPAQEYADMTRTAAMQSIVHAYHRPTVGVPRAGF
jgi:hypothetical protein